MKYRRKPNVVEAKKLSLENLSEVKNWCLGKTYSRPPMRAVTGLRIETLEGTMIADFGDYVVKGIRGGFYSCKPEIFELIYEPVSE